MKKGGSSGPPFLFPVRAPKLLRRLGYFGLVASRSFGRLISFARSRGIVARCGCGLGRGCRQWARRVAMGVEEGDDVGAILRLAETGKGHLGAGSKFLGVRQPLGKVGPIPIAALAGERIREGE